MHVLVRVETMLEGDVEEVASIDGPTRMDASQLRGELERPWSRLWVARLPPAAEVVAFVVAWHVADELHVLNVATRAEHRRQGIARTHMDEVVGYARRSRVKHVLLEVRRSNTAAIALYRGVGFFAMGVRARYYPDDEDAVEMVLMLDPDTGAVLAHDDEVKLER
jgi:ribosomal-protein-alanine N-acetyltransferase